jgi:hypothetical protein
VPITYDIDQAAEMVTVVLDGEVTFDELQAYFDATSHDRRFHGGLRRLVVSSGITGFPRSTEIEQFVPVARKRDAAAAGKVAVVAATPMSIGMTNMFFRLVGLSDSYEIFGDKAAAVAWLKTDPVRVKRRSLS